MRVGAVVAMGLALAAQPSSGFAQTTNPTWVARPVVKSDDFPRFASVLGVAGEAVVRCVVGPPGRPEGCEVISEAPKGLGFGAAAVEVVKRGRLDAGMIDGEVVERHFVSTIRFAASDVPWPSHPEVWTPPPSGRLLLARLVASFTFDRHPLFNEIDLGELPSERRAEVAEMIRQVRDDRSRMTAALAVILARSYTSGELALALAGWPYPHPPSSIHPFGREDVDPGAALRLRYCERWSCDPN